MKSGAEEKSEIKAKIANIKNEQEMFTKKSRANG